ncbi:MAG: hypothetical protein Q7S83_01255 [bacterium]|nr:hypothetical protein [bacterium]
MSPEFKKIIYWLLPLVLIVSFAFFIHGRLVNFSDADSFYHIRHSWVYRTTGLFNTSFPWVQYSVINQYAADIWYGFHMLILPFTYFQNLTDGINWGALFVTTIAASLFFLSLLKLKIRWPLLWLGVFLFASADLLYRITMLRPHPLSLGLSMLLFAYLSTKETSRSRWVIFFLAAGLSWLHLSLSWMGLLIVGVVSMIEFIQQRKISIWKYLTVILGLLTGLILRPNPIGATKLAYIQVVKLLFEKQGDAPLRFGRELTPFVWENFADQLVPIAILILIAVGFVIWLIATKKWRAVPIDFRSPIISSLALEIIFFLLTFGVARRSNEIFIGFAVLFVGLTFSQVKIWISKYEWQHYALGIAIFIALIYMPFKTMYRFDTYMAGTFPVDRFKEVTDWLKANTQPEEIVFNIHWDRFAQLFYHDQHNYFINGMDPIFEYAYDPSLYWKTHFLAIDAATSHTCGKVRCTAEEVEPIAQVLKKDFKASYILVEKQRSPKLSAYLNSAPEFNKVLDTDQDALYKIL